MAVNKITTPPIITKAGVKLATMRNNQHLSLNITHASFGTSKYNPTGNETALKAQRLKVGISSSVKINDKTIQMRIVVKAAKNQEFWCNEVGFWDGNVLFAVYSSANIEGNGLIFISDKIETTISFSLALEAMPVERIDVQIMQDVDKLTQIMSLHENEDNPHPQYSPLDLNDETESTKSIDGHTHKLPIASTTKKGIVQLTNDYNGDSEILGLTQKAGKALKALIDSLTRNLSNYIPNSKKSSSLTSNSADTVATSSAVKQLNDKITPLNFYKVPVKSSATPVTFDLSNREHWIAEIGSVYKGTGHYQLGLHNNATSTITNLPLNDKSPVQLDVSVMGAYSLIRCHYVYLDRTFTARADWNKSSFPLKWFEDVKIDNNGKVPRETVFAGSLESNLRVVARRNSTTGSPYFWMVDNGVNIDEDITTSSKMIGSIEARAGKNGTEDGEVKSVIRTHLKQDKNVEVEISTRNASNIWNPMLRMFSKTNNVSVGSGSDNGRDRLQVAGTVKATAPADDANNDQLPNTFWVRRFVSNTVNAAKEWVKTYWGNKLLTTEDLNNITTPGAYGQNANVNATAGRHYPEALAGSLLVTYSAYGVQQEYTIHSPNNHRKYVRNRTSTGWTTWQQVDGIDKVNKSGDTMTGDLTVPYLKVIRDNAWLNIISRNHSSAGIDLSVWGSNQAQSAIHCQDVGNYATEFRFFNTPPGENYATDRRQHVMTINPQGAIWAKDYGWLHDYFHHANKAYVTTSVRDGGFGGLDIVRRGNQGDFSARVEALPDKRWKFWTEHSHEIYLPVKSGTAALIEDFTYQKIGNFEIRRYPDGTMIQTYFVSFSNQSHYRHEHVYHFNWAVSFVEKPMVFGNGRIRDRNFNLVDNFQAEVSGSTGSTYYYYLFDPGGNQGNKDMMFLAIGRWKR